MNFDKYGVFTYNCERFRRYVGTVVHCDVGIMGWYVQNVVLIYNLKCDNVPSAFTCNDYR